LFEPETGEKSTPSETVRESETRAVSNFAKPFPVFDFLDDFADEFGREAETPVEVGSPLHIEEVSEGPKKKQSNSSSKLKPSILKTTPKPSRKSFRLASQCQPYFSKLSGGSKQEPVLVEDIVSSLDSSHVREAETTPEEQDPPEPSQFDKDKVPAEPQPESSLPSPKPSLMTEPSKPSLKTSTSKLA